MGHELRLAARAMSIFGGVRYNFDWEPTQDSARDAFLRAISTFMVDIRDFAVFGENERAELFTFGPFGSFGSVFMDSRGFVLQLFGEEVVLDLYGALVVFVSYEYRLCSIRELVTKIIPSILKERISAKLAACAAVDHALTPMML